MQRLCTFAFSAVVAALLAVPTPAQAQEIQNIIGNLCAQPDGGPSSLDGDVIKLAACEPYNDSHFWTRRFVVSSGGRSWFKLVNNATGRCLDLTDGNGTNGTAIQQWTCNNSTTMQWAFSDTPERAMKLINRRTGTCMDIPDGMSYVGQTLQSYWCVNESQPVRSQIWRLTQPPFSPWPTNGLP
jgi:hypothetical protein